MTFKNKETTVENLFLEQFDLLQTMSDEFKRFLSHYLANITSSSEEKYPINELEHKGDTIRREIEINLEKGAFMPLYREDYIVLAEMIDGILNRIQSTFIEITLTTPVFPPQVHDQIIHLAAVSLEAARPLKQIFTLLFESSEESRDLFAQIEKTEHTADTIEQDLIKKIFTINIEYAHRLHLREIVERLASFSDLAEDTGDRLQIMCVKRTI